MDNLNLRLVKASDIEITYKWANNLDIRKFSFNRNTLQLDQHSKWFHEKLNSSLCAYYILELGNTAIGSIRFDFENNKAKINYLIDPNYTGKGFGTIILKAGVDKLRSEYPVINVIYGYVFKDNLASLKIFENLGFKLVIENGNDIKFEKELK